MGRNKKKKTLVIPPPPSTHLKSQVSSSPPLPSVVSGSSPSQQIVPSSRRTSQQQHRQSQRQQQQPRSNPNPPMVQPRVMPPEIHNENNINNDNKAFISPERSHFHDECSPTVTPVQSSSKEGVVSPLMLNFTYGGFESVESVALALEFTSPRLMEEDEGMESVTPTTTTEPMTTTEPIPTKPIPAEPIPTKPIPTKPIEQANIVLHTPLESIETHHDNMQWVKSEHGGDGYVPSCSGDDNNSTSSAANNSNNNVNGFDRPEKTIKYVFDMNEGVWTAEEEPVVVEMALRPCARGTNRILYRVRTVDKMGNYSILAAKFFDKLALQDYVTVTDQMVFDEAKCSVWACKYASDFNRKNPPEFVQFCPVYVCRMVERPKQPLCIIEPLIESSTPFTKHNNNLGAVLSNRQLPQAFSHFTYYHSKQMLVICDIQGWGNVFTDPQIHSLDHKGFGVGDFGVKGIDEFLMSHTCGAVCGSMGLPRLVKGGIRLPWSTEQLVATFAKMGISYPWPKKKLILSGELNGGFQESPSKSKPCDGNSISSNASLSHGRRGSISSVASVRSISSTTSSRMSERIPTTSVSLSPVKRSHHSQRHRHYNSSSSNYQSQDQFSSSVPLSMQQQRLSQATMTLTLSPRKSSSSSRIAALSHSNPPSRTSSPAIISSSNYSNIISPHSPTMSPISSSSTKI